LLSDWSIEVSFSAKIADVGEINCCLAGERELPVLKQVERRDTIEAP
jgi:hypothetical protein